MTDGWRTTLWCVLLVLLVWSVCMQVEIHGYVPGTTGRPDACTYSSRSSVINIEVARSPTCFQQIVDPDQIHSERNATVLANNTWMDFVFIALYWTVFVLLATGYRGGWSKAVVCFISLSAAFDCLENYRILKGISEYSRHSIIRATPREFSMAKWVTLAVTLFCLGKVLWDAAGLGSRIHAITAFVASILIVPSVYIPILLIPAVSSFGAIFVIALVRYAPTPGHSEKLQT